MNDRPRDDAVDFAQTVHDIKEVVEQVHAAFEAAMRAGLTERALVLLVHDRCKGQVPIKMVREVLRATLKLDQYLEREDGG